MKFVIFLKKSLLIKDLNLFVVALRMCPNSRGEPSFLI